MTAVDSYMQLTPYTHETLTADVRDPEEIQELISDAEIEKDKIMLEKLLKEIDTIPKRYKAEAIHEMAAV